MNAPLPQHIRKAPETITLDENPPSGFRRKHKYTDGEAGCGVFGVQRVHAGVAL